MEIGDSWIEGNRAVIVTGQSPCGYYHVIKVPNDMYYYYREEVIGRYRVLVKSAVKAVTAQQRKDK